MPDLEEARAAADVTVTRSSRDPADTRRRLTDWLAGRLGPGAEPELGEVSSPASNGMSSESVLFEARWRGEAGPDGGGFVARLAPRPDDEPVFRHYDLEAQYRVMALVAEATEVPTPPLRWLETDPSHLDVPFLVMERVEGRVPTDVPPYALGGWVADASPDERRALRDATVAAIAGIHSVDVAAHDVGFLAVGAPGGTTRERHLASWEGYADWVVGDERSPLLDRAFAWLRDHLPDEPSDTVVSWGDARIGNILFEPEGFSPVAVLDWEMAALGTRDMDLGWACFLHEFFELVCRRYLGGPGLPDLLRTDDVRARYRDVTGIDPGDLRWAEVYAATRHAAIMRRVHARGVRFGEAEWPEDRDETILHRAALEQMLDGTWWDRGGAAT